MNAVNNMIKIVESQIKNKEHPFKFIREKIKVSHFFVKGCIKSLYKVKLSISNILSIFDQYLSNKILRLSVE